MTAGKLFHYRCEVTRVVDGDTIDVDIDLGFNIKYSERVRLLGINTPETRTRDLEEKAKGLEAKDFVINWLEDMADKCPIIETKVDKKGKLRRILGCTKRRRGMPK